MAKSDYTLRSGSISQANKGGLLKWIIIILVIIAILWYLNKQGYVSIPWF